MAQKIRKILVTGSSGTIGTRLCETLLENKYKVIGVDWHPNVWSKKINALTLRGDLRSKSTLRKLPKDIDLIIHLAANARVYNLVKDPRLARDNFESTFNVLDFAREHTIKKFIFASSREVYGNSRRAVYSENEARIESCESPYTASKIGGEALLHAYRQCYGIDFILFRFSNVYGMYDDSDRFVPFCIRLARENKDMVVFGKEKLLDFTYIDDCVDGVMRGVKKFPRVKNNTINIAYGRGEKLVDVARIIKNRLGSTQKIIIKPSRTGEVMRYVADISKAKKTLQYRPRYSIEKGLQLSIDWYLKNNEAEK